MSQAPLGRVNLRRLLAGAVIVLATAVAGVAWNHGGQGLVFPAVLVLALVAFESWGAMSGVPGRTAPAVEVPIDGPPEWVLRILFLTPPLVFSLALLQASVPDVAYDGRRAYVWLAIAAVVISAVAWPAALASSWSLGEWAPRALSWIVWALAITAVPAAWVYIDLWSASAVLGTIGVVAVFLIVAALALFGLTWVSERVTPPRLFALFGFRRIPVLALLVAWLAFASLVDKGTYHNVREAQTPTAAIDLQTAFNAWAQAHSYPLLDESAAQVQSKPDSRATPFVLVASEGGGIRAAYWTALVMNCLFDRSPASPDCNHEPSSQDVFVGSGASGGSLGLIEYAAHLLDAKPPVGTAWIGRSLGGDYVTPLVARGLFADLPNAFADFHGLFEDRAAILERSWQRSWPDNRLGRWTLQQLWTDRGSTARDATQLDRIPLLVLNGTAVDNGCRYNTSVLNVAVNSGLAGQAPSLVPDGCSSLVSFDNGGNSPTAALAGTEDLDDDLCRGSGVRLSTAALLSARFPWATPSGRVPRCGTSTAANVVDGGYFDNTGASTLLELYGRLRGLIDAYNGQRGTPCLVPLFVQIDNHYAGGSAPAGGPPPQVLVPPLTLNHVRDGHDSNGRQSAGEVFLRNVGPTGRLLPGWVHIAPRSHPGAEAPLGWTLSAGSKSDLADQLASSSNTTALADVRAWLSGGLKCSMTAP